MIHSLSVELSTDNCFQVNKGFLGIFSKLFRNGNCRACIERRHSEDPGPS